MIIILLLDFFISANTLILERYDDARTSQNVIKSRRGFDSVDNITLREICFSDFLEFMKLRLHGFIKVRDDWRLLTATLGFSIAVSKLFILKPMFHKPSYFDNMNAKM